MDYGLIRSWKQIQTRNASNNPFIKLDKWMHIKFALHACWKVNNKNHAWIKQNL